MTPVEELHAAAAKLREIARPLMDDIDDWAAYLATFDLVARGLAREDAAWIAGIPPTVAEPLAAWLEHSANDLGRITVVSGDVDPINHCDEPDSVRRALAAARAILGRSV